MTSATELQTSIYASVFFTGQWRKMMAMRKKEEIKVPTLQFAPTVQKVSILHQNLTECKCFTDMLMTLRS